MEKVLVTGASGLLGGYLTRIQKEDWEITGTWYTNMLPGDNLYLDITEWESVQEVFNAVEPTIVIHCAAQGSVDYCERHWDKAYDVIVRGVKYVVDAANIYGSRICFLSSNAVFDGEHPPYTENAPLNPINIYGQLKSDAEDVITDTAHQWMIVRPIMLYGYPRYGGRGNWATRTVTALRNGEKIRVVNDVVTQPTYAGELADTIVKLLDRGEKGVWNIGGDERGTLYEFAQAIRDVWGIYDHGLLEPVSSDEFVDLAPRPKDTTYDMTKLRRYDKSLIPSGIRVGLEKMRGEKYG